MPLCHQQKPSTSYLYLWYKQKVHRTHVRCTLFILESIVPNYTMP